jgi:predicted MFS family arabinose efflux permease
VAAGVAVANLYYAQPLTPLITRGLHATDRAVGVALTFTQLGYALGMIFLVPLGDSRERRGLLVMTAGAAVPALLLVAAAPGVAALSAFNLVLGVTSSLPQLAVPFAVGLVPLEERGRALGTVMGGLLAGLVLSRTFSGWLGHRIGWRGTFVAAAGAMACLATVLRLVLPRQVPAQRHSWVHTVRTLPGFLRDQPLLRRHAVVGAMGMASFSALWSTLAFHLARLGHGSDTAGLFGVFGVAGVIVAPLVGRLSHRVPPRALNVACLGLVAASFALLWTGRGSLAMLGAGVVLLDAGVQGSQLTNQAVIYGLLPEARNRINAVYMVIYFLGGALGTLLGAWGWGAAGWAGVCAAGAFTAAAGLAALWGVPSKQGYAVLAFLALLVLPACSDWRDQVDPTLAAAEPEQVAVEGAQGIVQVTKEHRIALTPRARYRITGYAVETSRVLLDEWDFAVPMDLALVWGPVADPAVLRHLSFHLSDRYVSYRYDAGTPRAAVGALPSHIANNHLIPANDAIARELEAIRIGDLVTLKGQLVDLEIFDASARPVFRARTSLTRSDVGSGACEILYVEAVERL